MMRANCTPRINKKSKLRRDKTLLGYPAKRTNLNLLMILLEIVSEFTFPELPLTFSRAGSFVSLSERTFPNLA